MIKLTNGGTIIEGVFMKKLYYVILLAFFLILDFILIFVLHDSTMWIFYASIVAEVAIYSTCIIFEIINIQNKLKDKKNEDDDNN